MPAWRVYISDHLVKFWPQNPEKSTGHATKRAGAWVHCTSTNTSIGFPLLEVCARMAQISSPKVYGIL